MRRPLLLLLAAAGGAATAVLGSAVHQGTWGARALPLGLAVALLLTADLGVLLRALRTPPPVAAAAVLGWFAVVWEAGGRRSEGDVVVPANTRGEVWLWVGFVVLLALAVLPARRPRRRG